ncbi:MAG: hypothetical protein ACYDC6_11095 [Acidobacteriaceae bacterium]
MRIQRSTYLSPILVFFACFAASNFSGQSVRPAAGNPYDWHIFAGYNFTRADISPLQDAANAITRPLGLPNYNVGTGLPMNGIDLDLQQDKNAWFSGVIDISGSFGSKRFFDYPGSAAFDPAIYTLTGGPQFTYPNRSDWQPFARLMLGAARGNLGPNSAGYSAIQNLSPPLRSTDNSFAVKTGIGVDYELVPRLAIRATADYLGTWLFQQTQANMQLALGADFHF